MTSQVCLTGRLCIKSLSNYVHRKAVKMAYPLLSGRLSFEIEILTKNFCDSDYCIYHWSILLAFRDHLWNKTDWPALKHLTSYEDSINNQWAHFTAMKLILLLMWPYCLSTLLKLSPGETNLPATQLHVRLAYGIAYGVTTRWLVSQTWEDARKRSVEETHLSLKRQLPNTHCLPIDWYWQRQLSWLKRTLPRNWP